MLREPLLRMCFSAAVVVVLATATSSQAKPPAIDIPEGLLSRSEPLSRHKNQMVARLDWWTKILREAKTEKEILLARKGLIGDYSQYDHPNYRNTFAKLAVGKLIGLLDGKGIEATDSLRKVKRINAAMALSEMPHSPVQSAMEKMVADKNEAIRYLGWKVYSQTRLLLMVGGDRTFGKMIASLNRAAKTENNGKILALVYGSMDLSGPEFDRFKDLRKTARGEFLKVLTATFPTRRRQILNGDLQIIHAARYTASPLAFMASGDSKKQAIQLIADLTDSAAKSYHSAEKARKVGGDGDEIEKANAWRIAGKKLLLAMEESLQSVIGKDETFLRDALTAPVKSGENRGANVETQWLKWAPILIDSHGVSLPQDPPKEPAKSKS